MQTIYFHNDLGPYRGFGNKERLYAPCEYHLDTISNSNVAILFFCSKNGVGVQNGSSWKTATTIWLYDVPRNVVEG